METKKWENYSYEDYLEIDRTTPEEERYELIFGHIYMMSGASRVHQDVVLNLSIALKQKGKERGCSPVVAPFDLKMECDGAIHVVQPDILLYCEDETLPCAIFEVLSPSTAYKDKTVKKELYERCGIREYCIVDLHERIVDLYRLTGTDDGKEWYRYVRGYGEEDRLYLECLGAEIEVEALFEGIETK